MLHLELHMDTKAVRSFYLANIFYGSFQGLLQLLQRD